MTKDLIQIRRLENNDSMINDFCQLQETTLVGELQVGRLPSQVWRTFVEGSSGTNTRFWVAYDADGRPVGRIGAHLMPSHREWGSIGFYEVDLTAPEPRKISDDLLDAACNWLRASGKNQCVGPMNLNTWFPYRFRTDQQTHRRFAWEPIHPAVYPEFWERYGFEPNASYGAFNTAGLTGFAERTAKAHERALDAGFLIRPFDGENFLERELPVLYEISMVAFRENHFFEPISLDHFRSLYVPIARKADFSCCFMICNKEEKPVGFSFSFIDGDSLVIKSLATLPEARGLGLSNALSHASAKIALSRGIENFLTAIIKTGAQSESYQRKGQLLWRHDYVLYQKRL